MFRRRRSKPVVLQETMSVIEALESRTLFSESASAQLHLVSTTGTQANPVFNYDITLTNTGTTNLGTFWFGSVPDENLLLQKYDADRRVQCRAIRASTITGSGSSLDGGDPMGDAIRWSGGDAGPIAGRVRLSHRPTARRHWRASRRPMGRRMP